ncbi:MAG: SCO1664 family protein [Actinobacteria bacterium]|uniref:Unannotated protein n=1 Tax=freshwater metagenome TaxID=449393 RepID=A0A6J7IQS3_9ZZZZ|nr:SCO1664 family protein [Actinomycetota bacterium]
MSVADRLPGDELAQTLATGELRIEGRLVSASNQTLRCTVTSARGIELRCVYKPVSGERPLWDFPDGHLAGREIASYELARLAGWDVIPTTVWRDDGPAGPGMCQEWIEEDPSVGVVDLLPIDEEHPGWMSVLEGQAGDGAPIRLVHADLRAVQEIALLDSITNNSDRKGGHVLVDTSGRVWGIDHGLTFHEEDKLRSVLWGWSGEPIPDDLIADLKRLRLLLDTGDADCVTDWLTTAEARALVARVDRLIDEGVFPLPSEQWPSIPWPVF